MNLNMTIINVAECVICGFGKGDMYRFREESLIGYRCGECAATKAFSTGTDLGYERATYIAGRSGVDLEPIIRFFEKVA